MTKSDIIKKNLIEAMIKCLGVVTDACKIAGISRNTFYRYYNTDDDFAKEIDDLSQVALDFAESKLFEKIRGVQVAKKGKNGEMIVYEQPPSDTAIIFYLKTKGKDRGYVERIQNEDVTQPELNFHDGRDKKGDRINNDLLQDKELKEQV